MDPYMKGAVEEYIENSRSVLEEMCERGVFSPADVEEQLESIRANTEKNIESNKPYAMLLIFKVVAGLKRSCQTPLLLLV